MVRRLQQTRWHSRAGFLATTLMVLVAIGAPLRVTAGLLEHGALFLPICMALLVVVGGPLTRLSLAAGQAGLRVEGDEAMAGLRMLLRVVLGFGALFVAAKAAGWIFAEGVFGLPEDALRYRERELTASSSAWHLALTPAFLSGAASSVFFFAVLGVIVRRRRLTALAWLAGPLLLCMGLLALLGVFVGSSLERAGALAALAAPVRTEPLARPGLWVDAFTVCLLAIGAQTGVLTTAGGGLPGRSDIGREARVLVSGIMFLLVVMGIAGLLLVCAFAYPLGIVPEAAHAEPEVLALELVPALGERLFPGWQPEWIPSARRVGMTWCFLVAVAGCAGGAGILFSGEPAAVAPRRLPKALGRAAMLVAAAAIAASWWMGEQRPFSVVLVLLPAILALHRLVAMRLGGQGLRAVLAALSSPRSWAETLRLRQAFLLCPPLLAGLAVLMVWNGRGHGIVLGGMAIAVGMAWAGTRLRSPQRSGRSTARIARTAPMLLTLAFLAPALAASDAAPPEEEDLLAALRPEFDFDATHARLVTEADDRKRRVLLEDFEQSVQVAMATGPRNGLAFDAGAMRDRVRDRALAAQDESLTTESRRVLGSQARDGLAALLLLDDGPEAGDLARRLNVPSNREAQRIFEAIQGSDDATLRSRVEGIHGRLGGARLERLFRSDAEPPGREALLVALAGDMREAFGAAGADSRYIRFHLLEAACENRTLLRPDPAPGAVYLACVLAVALMLAWSILGLPYADRSPSQRRAATPAKAQ